MAKRNAPRSGSEMSVVIAMPELTVISLSPARAESAPDVGEQLQLNGVHRRRCAIVGNLSA